MKRYILLGCGFFLLLKIASAYAAVGDITTVGGTGISGNNGARQNDLKQTQLGSPVYVLAYQYGLYVVDAVNHRVLRTSNKGGSQLVEPVAGRGTAGFSGDGGPAVDAELNNPQGITLDDKGNLYIADTGNHVIRKVDIGGTITTVAGTPSTPGDTSGGAAKSAQLSVPLGVAVDKTGNFLYIADAFNGKIRKVDINAGTISTFAGGGVGGDGGRAIDAQLNYPTGVTVHNDVVYIADSRNHSIRQVTSSGIIDIVAGNRIAGYSGNNGLASSASLNRPTDVTVDKDGNLFIADTGNNVIRKVNATTKSITTIAGIVTTGEFDGDNGPATAAKFNTPLGVTIDRDGNLYIADSLNFRVRKVEGVAASTTPPVVTPPVVTPPVVTPPVVTPPSGGSLVTSDLWIRAVISTEDKGPIEAVWKQGGDSKTSQGDRVIWGYFYANPKDVSWGYIQNPDLFVKIWYDHNGRVDVNFFHVSVPEIEVYSSIQGVTAASYSRSTMKKRYVRHTYKPKENFSEAEVADTAESPVVSVKENPSYNALPFYDLGLGAYIQTVEKGAISGVFKLGGSGSTSAGDQVAWGFFYANPADVNWGSSDNPDAYVKVWVDHSGQIYVNFFHVSVPEIKVYSGHNNRYEQQGIITMSQRYTRHEYKK